jgi:hypothetical protein
MSGSVDRLSVHRDNDTARTGFCCDTGPGDSIQSRDDQDAPADYHVSRISGVLVCRPVGRSTGSCFVGLLANQDRGTSGEAKATVESWVAVCLMAAPLLSPLPPTPQRIVDCVESLGQPLSSRAGSCSAPSPLGLVIRECLALRAHRIVSMQMRQSAFQAGPI